MSDQQLLSEEAAEFRRHFDQYYLGVIPRLLNEEGMFLAFVTMLTAIESLAGVYMPDGGAGERSATSHACTFARRVAFAC